MWLNFRTLRSDAAAAAVIAAALFAWTSCSKNSSGNDDVTDGTAPAIVTDLTVTGITATSVSLTWTAVGDDDLSGQAAKYDLRYWDRTVDWLTFDSAMQASGEPSPKASGQAETMTVTGLKTDSLYYFALKVSDEEGNYEGISNCVPARCMNDQVVAFADPALEQAVRTAIGLPSGDIHRSDLASLQELDADSSGITSLAGIDECTSLERLSLEYNAIADAGPLSDLTALAELRISENDIATLAPLTGLTRLARLYARANDIADISPLAGLSALSEVDLQNNYITDIAPLVGNDGLGSGDVIWLTLNPLSAQSIDDYIPALRDRGVIVNWWPDVQPPTATTDLAVDSSGADWATLSWTAPSDNNPSTLVYGYDIRYSIDSAETAAWTDATPLDSPPEPDLPGTTQSVRIDGLSTETTYFFAIKARDIYGNWSVRSNIARAKLFEDVVVVIPDTGLESALRATLGKPTGDILRSDLDTLTELHAQHGGIADLTGLEYCAQLRVLDLLDNLLTDLAPIAGLTALQQLQIGNNDVASLSPVSSLTGLQTLQFTGNPVVDLTPLSTLSNLWYLEAMSIEASDFTPVGDLGSMRYLFVSMNELTDIGFVTDLTQLTHFYADINAISDLSPLEGLVQLQGVSLQYNQVTDITPLVNNGGMGSGDVLNVQHNPLSQQCLDDQIPALELRGVTVSH